MLKSQKGSALITTALGLGLVGLLGILVYSKLNSAPVYYPVNPSPDKTLATTTGSGAPKGSHFNLNIIGKKRGECTLDATAEGQLSNGNRIFVPLNGKSHIMLSEGPFSVVDYCGLDGIAAFQLPNPDPTNSGTTTYSVYARALGKPGGKSTTSTCATDATTGDQYCSVYTMVEIRNDGKSTFEDVSKQLLYIYYDTNLDGILERYPLFDTRLNSYFWNYENTDLKLLQLRFYPVSTTVTAQ